MIDVAKDITVSDQAVIDGLLAKMEPKVRRRFLQIIGWLRSRMSIAEIQDLIATGRGMASLDPSELDRAAAAVADSVHAVYAAAARELAALLGDKLDTLVQYDAASFRAVRALQETGLRMVREIREEAIEVMRGVLADGLARGANPRATAREIRASIGLTTRQLEAVQNFRRLLEQGSADALDRALRDRRFDARVREAAGGGAPLSKAEIDRMVDRYRERALARRAETIARTETIGALHAGSAEMFQQAADVGDVDPRRLERKWVATRDSRTRDSHAAMNGQTVDFGDSFRTGDGYRLRYPHDPMAPASERINCRCSVVTRMKAAEIPLAVAA